MSESKKLVHHQNHHGGGGGVVAKSRKFSFSEFFDRIANDLIWGVSTDHIQKQYQNYMSDIHLDIGVGSGYFLKRTTTTAHSSEGQLHRTITLVDVNPRYLKECKASLESYTTKVNCHAISIMGPGMQGFLPRNHFESVGISLLFHHLPNTEKRSKWKALDNIIPLVKDDGVVFGSTIISGTDRQHKHRFLAKVLLVFNNAIGVFSNREDSLGTILANLNKRFLHVQYKVEGSVLLFEARKPIRDFV